jgi:hypothetical protein
MEAEEDQTRTGDVLFEAVGRIFFLSFVFSKRRQLQVRG